MTLLHLQDVGVEIIAQKGMAQGPSSTVLSHIELAVRAGEIVAIVGASGAGKTMLAQAIMGILPQSANRSGIILYDGLTLTPKRQAALRGHEIVFIPQSTNMLDPLMRVGKQVRLTKRPTSKQANLKQVQAAFTKLGLPTETMEKYPHECSGGMMRRVMLSMAMVSEAKLIIADEPTPGLHPDMLNMTLEALQQKAKEGCGVLIITHQLDSVLQVAHHIAVMHEGTVVEVAPATNFHGKGESLRHPYSQTLWQAMPGNQFTPMSYTHKVSPHIKGGCSFADQCSMATEICSQMIPPLRELRGGQVRCAHAT